MKPESKSPQDKWKEYRDACYPQGCVPIQNRECHQAFFAGALVMARLMDEIAKLPQDLAIANLRKLTTEALQVCQYRADTLKGRN